MLVDLAEDKVSTLLGNVSQVVIFISRHDFGVLEHLVVVYGLKVCCVQAVTDLRVVHEDIIESPLDVIKLQVLFLVVFGRVD